MCRSIRTIYTCSSIKTVLERCPSEFEEGHTLGYVKEQLHTACDECLNEEKLRRRVKELQQQLDRIKERALAYRPRREDAEDA
jgi:hypothetical protein